MDFIKYTGHITTSSSSSTGMFIYSVIDDNSGQPHCAIHILGILGGTVLHFYTDLFQMEKSGQSTYVPVLITTT